MCSIGLERVINVFPATAPESCAGALQISGCARDGPWPGLCPCLRPGPALSGLLPSASLLLAHLSTGTLEARMKKSSTGTTAVTRLPYPPHPRTHPIPLPSASPPLSSSVSASALLTENAFTKESFTKLYGGVWYLFRHD